MNFDNQGYFRFYFTDNIYFTINDTIISTWIIGAILITLAIIVRIKIKNFKDVPETGFQNIIEAIVEKFDDYVVSIMTKEYAYFGSWFFGLFLFLMVGNIFGIFAPMRTPTADLSLTFALGISTVVLMQIIGIRHNKDYIKDFFRPFPLFMPLNVVSDLSKSISLSIRLFGNMLGGLIIMALMYELLPRALNIAFPAVLSLYFDIFAGLLHAFIFFTLSMYFMMMKAPAQD